MGTAALITAALFFNLGVFVCYPDSGRFGFTFLYISGLLWTGFAILLGSRPPYTAAGRAVRLVLFAAGCLFSCLSFLPQRDNAPPLKKLTAGRLPDRGDVFTGLLRLGITVPSLAPPPKPEVLP